MSVVMKLCGDALGRPTGYDGQYLKGFDFEADDGEGLIDMTPDLAQAKHFPTMVDALIFYRTVPKCRPFASRLLIQLASWRSPNSVRKIIMDLVERPAQ